MTEQRQYRLTEQDQLVQLDGTIEQAWRAFHQQNPHVYRRLVELAQEWRRRRPGSKLGIGMLFERLRWDLAIQTTGEALKLNNNYRSYYSREIMEREPELRDIFATRRLRAPR
jgi:ATP-dependent protease HslVU (ClpYQ) peptidase subunit